MLQESRVLLEFLERTELQDAKGRGDHQACQAALERRETLERTVPRGLTGLQDPLVLQDSEASWVSPESEEREA